MIQRNKARSGRSKDRTSKGKRIKTRMNPKQVRQMVGEIFGPTQHAARVESLANAVVGITHVAVLAIHAIGQAYAQVAGITAKSGVKQIDRLLSNSNLVMDRALKTWVAFVVGVRTQVVIALDW